MVAEIRIEERASRDYCQRELLHRRKSAEHSSSCGSQVTHRRMPLFKMNRQSALILLAKGELISGRFEASPLVGSLPCFMRHIIAEATDWVGETDLVHACCCNNDDNPTVRCRPVWAALSPSSSGSFRCAVCNHAEHFEMALSSSTNCGNLVVSNAGRSIEP